MYAREPYDGNGSGEDDVLEHVPRADRRKLIEIADHNEPRPVLHSLKKRIEKRNVDHAHLVDYYDVGLDGVRVVPREALLAFASVLEKAMDGLCLP